MIEARERLMVRIIADLQIHSRYSRATSANMTLSEIAHHASVKGLSIVGTGDLTHPTWRAELKHNLVEVEGSGLYRLRDYGYATLFMMTGEVSTVFEFEGRTRKIHHVILSPDLGVSDQIAERLSKFGELRDDGRPTLDATPAEVVEELVSISRGIMVFPAHAWTPWYGIFGAKSGVNSLEECYQDMTKHIRALETGLSSDPPMNWRVSELDGLTLVSNSDAHSPWPWRLGREANAFELREISYRELVNAIRTKDPKSLLFTVETDPSYGKYHWSGHRRCGVSFSARDARQLQGICPKCGRKLTKGVEERVEELADRAEGYVPEGSIGYVRLLPLSEIIAVAMGLGPEQVNNQAVWSVYNRLVQRFGSEYEVLLNASESEIAEQVGETIAKAVMRTREGKVRIVPGFDGVYGAIDASSLSGLESTEPKPHKQPSLLDYI